MPVRDATHTDVPQVVGLIADFYAEAPYDAPQVNPDKSAHVLHEAVENIGQKICFKVYTVGDYYAGTLLAERHTDLWSDAVKTIDHLLYVRPPFRGRAGAGKLIMAYHKWSQVVPSVVRIEASSGLNDEQAAATFAKLGYGPRGTLHGMEAY